MHEALMREFSLTDRVVVITGAASGLGRGAACVLAEAGAIPVLADVDERGLAETADLVAEVGGKAVCVPTDVSSRAAIDTLAGRAAAVTGRLDGWVNVAGIIVNRSVIDVDDDDLERMIAINLKGTYWGCAAAGRLMGNNAGVDGRGGAIVNFSSSGADTPPPNLSIYSLTKNGVNSLTRTVAKEMGPYGIRCNAIAPGWVETPMGTNTFRNESGAIDPEKYETGLKQRAAASPLGITGTPRDIGLAVLYLVSDASRFMTGQIVRPNGGVAMP
jgi:3-oxoacyl-[acyl-carrier protein] reductase